MIGKNIKKVKRQRGLSQEKLARLTDVSLNTLTKLKNTKIFRKKLFKLRLDPFCEEYKDKHCLRVYIRGGLSNFEFEISGMKFFIHKGNSVTLDAT